MWTEKINATAATVAGELWDIGPGDRAVAVVAVWSESDRSLALTHTRGLPGFALPTLEDVPILPGFDRIHAAKYLGHMLDPFISDLGIPPDEIESVEGLLASDSDQVGHHRLIGEPTSSSGPSVSTGNDVVFPFRMVLSGHPIIRGGVWRSLPETKHDLDSRTAGHPRQTIINRAILRRIMNADLDTLMSGGLQLEPTPSYSVLQQRGTKDD